MSASRLEPRFKIIMFAKSVCSYNDVTKTPKSYKIYYTHHGPHFGDVDVVHVNGQADVEHRLECVFSGIDEDQVELQSLRTADHELLHVPGTNNGDLNVSLVFGRKKFQNRVWKQFINIETPLTCAFRIECVNLLYKLVD